MIFFVSSYLPGLSIVVQELICRVFSVFGEKTVVGNATQADNIITTINKTDARFESISIGGLTKLLQLKVIGTCVYSNQNFALSRNL